MHAVSVVMWMLYQTAGLIPDCCGDMWDWASSCDWNNEIVIDCETPDFWEELKKKGFSVEVVQASRCIFLPGLGTLCDLWEKLEDAAGVDSGLPSFPAATAIWIRGSRWNESMSLCVHCKTRQLLLCIQGFCETNAEKYCRHPRVEKHFKLLRHMFNPPDAPVQFCQGESILPLSDTFTCRSGTDSTLCCSHAQLCS